MIDPYNILGDILFSQSLCEIRQDLEYLKKDSFDPLDRIRITQDIVDEYPYVDGVGTKLIEIQKMINQVDISNCFILLVTANRDASREVDFVTKFYSVDPVPIEVQLVEGEYKKKFQKYTNTACRKLWNHFYLGTDGNVTACCIADHRFPLGNIDEDAAETIAHNAQKIRSVMSQGYRPRACATCYEKEDSGIRSQRQACDPMDVEVVVKDIDLRLNNICNFKCRMCSEYFSSAIQQETIELYGPNPVMGFEKVSLSSPNKTIRNQRLEKVLHLVNSDLESVYFAGGEPLITGEHYQILDQLLTLQNTDLALRYNTNLSTLCYKQHNVLDRWRQFSNVSVGASIDASGEVAEYMRHGTNWQQIVDNIRMIRHQTPHVKLRVTSVVSSLTMENLIDLQTNWINQRLFDIDDFEMQVLISPNFLSPAVLPVHHKHRISDIIDKHIQHFAGTSLAKHWQDVLHWMNHNDYTHTLKDFVHRTRVLDAHRNQSFAATFPQFRDLDEF